MLQSLPEAANEPGTLVVVSAQELVRRRIERALRARARYRYVHPEVRSTEHGWQIVSPCCSRTVAPDGSVIDIALLQQEADGAWLLHASHHSEGGWYLFRHGSSLDLLLQVLCADTDRVFWP